MTASFKLSPCFQSSFERLGDVEERDCRSTHNFRLTNSDLFTKPFIIINRMFTKRVIPTLALLLTTVALSVSVEDGAGDRENAVEDSGWKTPVAAVYTLLPEALRGALLSAAQAVAEFLLRESAVVTIAASAAVSVLGEWDEGDQLTHSLTLSLLSLSVPPHQRVCPPCALCRPCHRSLSRRASLAVTSTKSAMPKCTERAREDSKSERLSSALMMMVGLQS